MVRRGSYEGVRVSKERGKDESERECKEVYISILSDQILCRHQEGKMLNGKLDRELLKIAMILGGSDLVVQQTIYLNMIYTT